MRIAIVGAGGVGGYYGARLARAGNEVIVFARGANLEAIRDRGIEVRSELGNFTAAVRAEEDAARIGRVDLVILAVKTYSNAEVLPVLPQLVGPGTIVLPLQNGIDSADEIAAVTGPAPVLAGITYIGATLVAPGTVQQAGSIRRIVFGEAFGPRVVTERVSTLRDVLAAADIQAEAEADSRIAIWEKFIFLAPLAAMTAAARLPVAAAWAAPAFRSTFDCAMAEAEALARHAGVNVAADIRPQKMRFLDATPATMRTSMMVDLVAGRPIELEALVGTIVRRGRAAGIPTPVAGTLYAVLQPWEKGNRS